MGVCVAPCPMLGGRPCPPCPLRVPPRCLLDGRLGRSRFLPQRRGSALRFQLDSFLFPNASSPQVRAGGVRVDSGVPAGQFWQEDACPRRSSSAVTCGQRWRGPVAAGPAPTTARRPPGAPRTVPTAPAAAPRMAAGAGGGGRMMAQVRAGSTGRCWRCERSAAHGISLQGCWAQPASACGCSRHRPARPRHRSLAQPR